MVLTLRDPVTSTMAAHHAPRVYENGGKSRLLFHVAAFIEMLEEKQPTGVGWLLENVDTSGDERLCIKESEKYITKIIGR
eukprot:jgi/Tetstr1/431955/TSEL_021432.t1